MLAQKFGVALPELSDDREMKAPGAMRRFARGLVKDARIAAA